MANAALSSKIVDLDVPIALPQPMTWRCVDGQYLFIDTLQANWLPADQLRATLLMAMSWGETPREALRFAQGVTGADPETLLAALTGLLTEIERRQFYAGIPSASPYAEDKREMHVYLTRGCNLHCPQCYMAAGRPLKEEMSTADWLEALDRFTELNGPGTVTFSGGEPLLRDDFFLIAAHAHSLGHALILITNGTLIEDAATAARIAGLFMMVQVSLDGATAVVHDFFRGAGNFERALCSIRWLAAAGMSVNVGVTVMTQNIADLQAHLVELLDALDCPRLTVSVSGAFAEGRARGGRFTYDPAAIQTTIDAIMGELEQGGWGGPPPRRRRAPVKSCGYGAGVILAANGDVHPCPILRRPIGNIKTISLLDLDTQMTRLYHEYDVDHLSECKTCDLRYICGGGCRIANLRERGDLRLTSCTQAYKDALCRELLRA